ncbi:flagellin [Peribacillus sp. FSL M8-0224]|uniref:flagellin n=1 Tax=Peribacillus sp. FSL M8-0224 TaxID=2921568 RepID=UPI0030FB3D71
MFNKRFRRYIQDSSVVLSITSKEVGSSAGVEVVLDNGFFFSAQPSQLGAFQNLLVHTINNLKTSSENLTAAESVSLT